MINLDEKIFNIYKNTLDSINIIELSNLEILKFEYIEETVETRELYIKEIFTKYDGKRKEQLNNITRYLADLKDTCIHNQNELKEILKIESNIEIDLEEVVKDDKLFSYHYLNNNISIIDNNYHIDLLNKDIKLLIEVRTFIHQALNILGQSSNIFVEKVLKKEQEQQKIKKSTQDLITRMMISNSNIFRLHNDYNSLLNIKDNTKVNSVENLTVKVLLEYLISYQDRLSDYDYNQKQNIIKLDIENKVEDENIAIPVNIYKYIEILEVILYNAAEELCNKESEMNTTNSKTISFQIYTEGTNLIIRIKDNGRGIEDISKIFNLNYTTKSDHGGSGIGLFAAKKIADYLNVNISVNTKNNVGSTFYIFKEMI
ncbi:MAG: hypothetical protein DRG78_02340 [Epsilonproteobacteria bacterium]|nr:MAG: hypothetical protein DRG78_02340 [Campylobacterota bacterium]